jgi:hypothetical protein
MLKEIFGLLYEQGACFRIEICIICFLLGAGGFLVLFWTRKLWLVVFCISWMNHRAEQCVIEASKE